MYEIVDQTESFVMINKSQGVSVHKDQNDTGLTMQLQKDLGLKQIYLIHRLDKITSGLMVFAKSAEAASELSRLFRERLVSKFYLAISDRKPRRKQGAIIGDMAKSRRGSWKLLSAKTDPAITQFFSVSLKPGFRLFILKPTTGKTHQIRVALKSEGAPIYGDSLYSGSSADRVYLHAYRLSFEYQGTLHSYSCLPQDGALFDHDAQLLIDDFCSNPEQINWPNLKIGK
ncbi:TIGR01621 family pseudouridine synthase [Neptuniibacter sp. UBA6509]|uniref:TIGR01621 family pseudouridine synthase n=2 Tax=unclassified Neptuniibacter TaxID=2630693 RepID=UPI000C6A752E|nr:TIGR01621 family pseudouridine synthase [Neptuniibacter sp. UBA6509]MAY43329.1 TIGR01621 family pseudouridine synthase [Oceanospirillaceae bacterium]